MRITRTFLVAAVALLCVSLGQQAAADEYHRGFRLEHAIDKGLVVLDYGGGLAETQILNLGERSSASAAALANPCPIKSATVDTVRLGTVKRTVTWTSRGTDSLMVGTGLLGRSVCVLSVAGTDNNINAGDIRVAGRDIFGTKVVQTFTFTDNTELSAQGTSCMAYLDSLTIPAAAASDDVAIWVGRGSIVQVPFTGAFTCPLLQIHEGGTWKAISASGMVDTDSCYASATTWASNGICIQQTAHKNSLDYELLWHLSKYRSASAATPR